MESIKKICNIKIKNGKQSIQTVDEEYIHIFSQKLIFDMEKRLAQKHIIV